MSPPYKGKFNIQYGMRIAVERGSMSNDSTSVLTMPLNADQQLADFAAFRVINTEPEQEEFSYLVNPSDPLIRLIIQYLKSELKNYDSSNTLFIETAKQDLENHLLKRSRVSPYNHDRKEKGLTQKQLNKVNNYIRSNYFTDITLKDLADLVSLSEYHFARLYKQAADITPYQYILHCRFEKAQQLLTHTELTMQQIAFEIGYKDDSSFSKAFNKFFGIAPGKYRKQNRK